jgi:hypothetical protein
MPEGAHILPPHRPLHAVPKRRRITPIRAGIAAVPELSAAVILAATAQAEPPRPVPATLTAGAGHTVNAADTAGAKHAGDTAAAKHAADTAGGAKAADAAKPNLNCRAPPQATTPLAARRTRISPRSWRRPSSTPPPAQYPSTTRW